MCANATILAAERRNNRRGDGRRKTRDQDRERMIKTLFAGAPQLLVTFSLLAFSTSVVSLHAQTVRGTSDSG